MEYQNVSRFNDEGTKAEKRVLFDKIKAMLNKYRAETIDIEDITFEEADLELSELFPTIDKASGDCQPTAGTPFDEPLSTRIPNP